MANTSTMQMYNKHLEEGGEMYTEQEPTEDGLTDWEKCRRTQEIIDGTHNLINNLTKDEEQRSGFWCRFKRTDK